MANIPLTEYIFKNEDTQLLLSQIVETINKLGIYVETYRGRSTDGFDTFETTFSLFLKFFNTLFNFNNFSSEKRMLYKF